MFKQNQDPELSTAAVTSFTLTNSSGLVVVRPLLVVAAYYYSGYIVIVNRKGRSQRLKYDELEQRDVDWNKIVACLTEVAEYLGHTPWQYGAGTDNRTYVNLDYRNVNGATLYNTECDGPRPVGVQLSGDDYCLQIAMDSESAEQLVDIVTQGVWKSYNL